MDHLLKISWRYIYFSGCPTYLTVVINLDGAKQLLVLHIQQAAQVRQRAFVVPSSSTGWLPLYLGTSPGVMRIVQFCE